VNLRCLVHNYLRIQPLPIWNPPQQVLHKDFRSLSIKCPSGLKNSRTNVKFFVTLKFFARLNFSIVSGFIRAPVECLSRNSFQSANNSSGEVMILTSFFRSEIPLMFPPSFSGLILWN
jgi:hypothetical protein